MVEFTWDASGLELASRFDRLPQNHAMQGRTFDRVPCFATLDTELDTQPHRKAAEAWGGAITARCFVECEPIPVFFMPSRRFRQLASQKFKQLQNNSLRTASRLVFFLCPSHICGEKFIADCHDDTSKLGSGAPSSFPSADRPGQLHVETRGRSSASIRNANWARPRHPSTRQSSGNCRP